MGLMALLLATGLLWVTSAFAQDFTAFETGDELFDVCNVRADDQRHFLCSGYIAGASDVLNSQGAICTPKDVTVHQTVDVILDYLREHPAQRHMAAPVLTEAALGQAFSCK
jgi:Rap1a immunity proteins